jgi:hypothetical protein
MKMSRLFLSVALLVATSPVFAQDAAKDAHLGKLREAMTDTEFKAAGLDKLSPAELATLDEWLQRRVGQQTAQAVRQAKQEGRKEVEQETRGFFDFGTAEPIKSTIVGAFTGFAQGRQYTLANGQVWEQVEAVSLAGVRRQDPTVNITPSRFGNKWFLKIDGYNTAAPVRRIK